MYLHHFGLSSASSLNLDQAYESWLSSQCMLEKSPDVDSWQLKGFSSDLDPLDFLKESANRSFMQGEKFIDPSTTSVIVASSRGNLNQTLKAYDLYKSSGFIHRKTSPLSTPSYLATLLSKEFGLHGSSQFLSASCNSSLQAIIAAAGQLSLGLVESTLVAGVEVPSLFLVKQLGELGVLQKQEVVNHDYPCVPFSENRKGMVLGYGAASVVVSRKPSDIRLSGMGSATLSKTIAGIDRQGLCLQNAFQGALKIAKLKKSDIDVIFAHGSGTKVGDQAESNAYKSLYQDQEYTPKIVSHKWMWGHAIGASGLMSLVLAKNVFEQQQVADFPYLATELNALSETEMNNNSTIKQNSINHIAVVNLGFSGVASVVILSYKR